MVIKTLFLSLDIGEPFLGYLRDPCALMGIGDRSLRSWWLLGQPQATRLSCSFLKLATFEKRPGNNLQESLVSVMLTAL